MDSVRVATSGTINRKAACLECHEPMYYRVKPGTEDEVAMFCGNIDGQCPAALTEIPDPERGAQPRG